MPNFTSATALLPVVAAALCRADGSVLLQQRPPGKQLAGLWEFPGGKIEPGETPEQALVRELHEELGITVDPAMLEPVTFASEPLGSRHLVLLLYATHAWTGDPRPLDAAALRWLQPVDMSALPMPPADKPLVAALIANARGGRLPQAG